MKRKVIVACGGAVATSTMAAEEIKELCADHNICLLYTSPSPRD